MDVIARWHEQVAQGDPALLDALIAEDCVFQSPAVHSPQVGKAVTLKYLRAAMAVLNNPTFRYPRNGGIHMLPDRLAERVPGIRYREEATEIDTERHTVTTSRGARIPYSAAVNTMPLPLLLARLKPHETGLAQAGSRLDWTEIYDLNLGIARPRVSAIK